MSLLLRTKWLWVQSNSVAAKLANISFHLINKHFAAEQKFYEIFNSNTSMFIDSSSSMDGWFLTETFCTMPKSHETTNIRPKYIKELVKILLTKLRKSEKILLTLQPTKMTPNFLPSIGPLKQISLNWKYHAKTKGDISPKTLFLEDSNYAWTIN